MWPQGDKSPAAAAAGEMQAGKEGKKKKKKEGETAGHFFELDGMSGTKQQPHVNVVRRLRLCSTTAEVGLKRREKLGDRCLPTVSVIVDGHPSVAVLY